METSKFNWEIVEEIAKTVFPDEYEMATPKQVKEIEKRISEGQSPFVQRQTAGGMPMDFGAAINVVANIMVITNIIVTWYISTRPKEQELSYDNFRNSINQDNALNTLFVNFLSQEAIHLLERYFDQIIEALSEIIKALND